MKRIGEVKVDKKNKKNLVDSIVGSINVGHNLIQVDKLPDEVELKAPIGTYVFDSAFNVKEKTGKKDTDWTRTTFRVMMMNILSWAVTMLDSDEESRKEMIKHVHHSIETFKGGESSKEGIDAVKYLRNECELVGFSPSTTYIMHKERGEGSLNVFWEHPFSIPTLLYKHKRLPFLILSNGNLDFDDSRLIKMGKMEKIEVDEPVENPDFEDSEVRGITG